MTSDEDLEKLRRVCRIGREALDAGHAAIAPGVTTEEIDRIVHEYIIGQGAYPSPRNYYNFPAAAALQSMRSFATASLILVLFKMATLLIST